MTLNIVTQSFNPVLIEYCHRLVEHFTPEFGPLDYDVNITRAVTSKQTGILGVNFEVRYISHCVVPDGDNASQVKISYSICPFSMRQFPHVNADVVTD